MDTLSITVDSHELFFCITPASHGIIPFSFVVVYFYLTGIQDHQKSGGSSSKEQLCCWFQMKMLNCKVVQNQNHLGVPGLS